MRSARPQASRSSTASTQRSPRSRAPRRRGSGGKVRPSLLTRDGRLLVAARAVRMFAYGFLSVILALYLSAAGLSASQIGWLFTVALAGGAATTAVVSLMVNRWGRRRTLIASALLMAAAGIALATRQGFLVLLPLSAIGALSPTGQENGPFLSLEQAALSQTTAAPHRVMPYAWFNLAGSVAAALGALAAGAVPAAFRVMGGTAAAAEQSLIWASAAAGVILAGQYLALSAAVEVAATGRPDDASPGLGRSRRAVIKLTALFGVDALAGGLVVQSLVAFWLYRRFGVDLESLGLLFFGTNLLSGLVPFMPSWPLAAAMLLARSALSQMDVPTRQAYTMALVAPEERAAAAGLTNAVRPAAQSLAPAISGLALQSAASGLPFVLAGALKAAYDLTLWVVFRRVALQAEPTSGQTAEGPGTPCRPDATREGHRQR